MQPRPKSGDIRKSKARQTRSICAGVGILKTVRFSNDSAFIGPKLGLNRREHRLCSRRALERLEPDEAKVSRPVLRGGSGGNAALLPDLHRLPVGPVPLTTTPVPFRKKRARHERHPHSTEYSACFRLRFGDGRFAPLRSCVSAPTLHFSVRQTAGRSLELNNYYGKYKTRRFSSIHPLAKRRGRETRHALVASCQLNEYWEFHPM